MPYADPDVARAKSADRMRKMRESRREQARLAEGRAKASLTAPPRRERTPEFRDRKDDPVKHQLFVERKAYLTLLSPVRELGIIAEQEGKTHALLEQMSPDQRTALGRMARKVVEVVAIVAALPDPERDPTLT